MTESETQICVECGEPTARSKGDSLATHGGEHFAEAHSDDSVEPAGSPVDP